VEIVLVERILEAAFPPINLLRPLALFFRAEDPARVVFRLHHEDPERGNDHVIELGAALAVGARQVDVVENAVARGIEACQASGDRAFADPPLEAGGAEDFDEDHKRQQAENQRPVGDEGFNRLGQVDCGGHAVRCFLRCKAKSFVYGAMPRSADFAALRFASLPSQCFSSSESSFMVRDAGGGAWANPQAARTLLAQVAACWFLGKEVGQPPAGVQLISRVRLPIPNPPAFKICGHPRNLRLNSLHFLRVFRSRGRGGRDANPP
jgi:hypothetical protein